MARPANAESPEANIIRDELRQAVRAIGELTGYLEYVMTNASQYLARVDAEADPKPAGERRRTRAVRIDTIADFGRGVPISTPAARPEDSVQITEDGPERT